MVRERGQVSRPGPVGAGSRLGGLRARWRRASARRQARRSAGHRVLRAFAADYPDPFFIEIGANDGVRGDHLAPFIRSRRWSGVMVEPVPHVFERLRRNYGDLDRVALENVAIADRDGRLPFYHLVPAREAGAAGGDQVWSDAFGSFSRDAVLRTAAAYPGLDRRLERMEVPCLSFESLCRRHRVDRLDLLVIDTEGYDAEILRQIDFGVHRPRVLVYEYCHLSRGQRDECNGRLEGLGYETMDESLDTWCVDARPDDALTRRWREILDAGPAVSEDDLRRWFEGVAGHEPG